MASHQNAIPRSNSGGAISGVSKDTGRSPAGQAGMSSGQTGTESLDSKLEDSASRTEAIVQFLQEDNREGISQEDSMLNRQEAKDAPEESTALGTGDSHVFDEKNADLLADDGQAFEPGKSVERFVDKKALEKVSESFLIDTDVEVHTVEDGNDLGKKMLEAMLDDQVAMKDEVQRLSAEVQAKFQEIQAATGQVTQAAASSQKAMPAFIDPGVSSPPISVESKEVGPKAQEESVKEAPEM